MNKPILSIATLGNLAAMLLLFFGAANPAFAAAGKIQFAIGDVKIQDSKQAERPAKKGAEVEQGDTIITGASGSVQVTLADGGMLAVRPNTQMRIDAYAYSGKADDKNNKSVFSLAKGTFRSITGAIGQNNKEAYQVNTPGATMGIRGTDHEPAVILPSPGLPPLPPGAPQPGTYDRVNAGQTFIQTSAGLLLINANQVGFAPAGGGAPVVLPNVPSFYSSAPKPGAAKKVAAQSSTRSSTQSGSSTTTSGSTTDSGTASGDTGTESTSGGTTDSGSTTDSGTTSGDTGTGSTSGSTTDSSTTETFSTDLGGTTETSIGSDGGSTVSTDTAITTDPAITEVAGTAPAVPPPPPPSPPVPALVGANYPIMAAMSSGAAGSARFIDPNNQSLTLGGSGELLNLFDGLSSPTFTFDSASATLLESNVTTFNDGGVAYWGRWSPGFTVQADSMPVQDGVSSFHYAYTLADTPFSEVTSFSSTLVDGTYLSVGGTMPTNLTGMASMTAANASLTVNFATQFVRFDVTTTISAQTLTGFAEGGLLDFVSPNIGISTPMGAMINTTTKAFGQFVGPTAAGAIVSYEIRDNGGSIGAIGVSVLQRSAAMMAQ